MGSHRQSVPSYPLNQHHSLLINSKSKSKSKSKMPNIKLYYGEFPFWRAEVSRLALHLGKVPFENVTSMNLQALRESGKATLGQMPILEVDGKTCVQTGAIARYCGKQSGLYPRDDDWAAAKIDEIIDTATDITVAVGKTMRVDDAAVKAAGRAELAATTLPKYLTALEKMMSENGSTGFYVGNKMTIADLAMWRMWGWIAGGILDGIPTTLLDAYPQVKKHTEAIGAVPEVAAWMARYKK